MLQIYQRVLPQETEMFSVLPSVTPVLDTSSIKAKSCTFLQLIAITVLLGNSDNRSEAMES